MIKRNQKLIRTLNYLTDAVLIYISYYIAVYLKYIIIDGLVETWAASRSFTLFIICYSLLLPGAYYAFRIYAQRRFAEEAGEYFNIVLVNLIGTLFAATSFYVLRETEFSRVALFLFFVISSALVVLKHFTGRRIVVHYRNLGYNKRHVILIGSGNHAIHYKEDISKEKRLGIEIDGYVSSVSNKALGNLLGNYNELEEIIEKRNPDEIVIALEPHELEWMAAIMEIAGKEGTHISLIPFYNDYIPPHPEIDSFGRTKLINLRATPMDSFIGSFIKRTADIVLSFLMLLLLSPLMTFTAIGVKLSSPGPVFFRQQRVGKDKKIFSMLKFRSMRVNAEENTAWSTNEDPRKTRFGSFIRKYSIDELPQLFNVLKGDMSLIGPRPEIPFYVRQFNETVPLYLVRQQVRPGMTGWAQVHGLRGDTSIEERVKYDIWYIENWSLFLDIRILFITVFRGAFKNDEKLV